MTALNLSRNHRSGFALVSAVSVLALLLLIGLAILSLSTSTTRESKVDRHAEIARANARMALAIAIAQLQEAMGPDQRVSATADILANSNAPLPGREKWVGVWKTTFEVQSGQESPMVGKSSDGGGSVYKSDAYYEDLRHTNSDLNNDQWKEKLHQAWLASGNVDVTSAFTGEKIEILSARGQEQAVEVGLVPVEGAKGEKGNYAWWVGDNSLKAALGTKYDPAKSVDLAIAPYAEPATIDPLNETGEGAEFADLTVEPSVMAKYASYSSIQLAHKDTNIKQALKDSYHDFTTQSFGMPIDTAYGGFKKDLTALLQGGKSGQTLSFLTPSAESVFPSVFESKAPIIPGKRHATMGPKFASLRHWTQFSLDNPGNSDQTAKPIAFNAETVSPTGKGIRPRDSEGWAWLTENEGVKEPSSFHQDPNNGGAIRTDFAAADGLYFGEETWAEDAPKFHPVMTDARWHYYVNFGFDNPNDPNINLASDDEGFMSHIIPRVCLWNPYSRPITFERLVVLMPNPLASGSGYLRLNLGNKWTVQRKAAWGLRDLKTRNAGSKGQHDFEAFGALQFFNGSIVVPRYSGQQWGNMDPIGNGSNDKDGLFPASRYLGFVLEGTTIEPGENLVFSPKMSSSDYPTDPHYLVQQYDKNSIESHILSADSIPGENHFVNLCTPQFVGFEALGDNRKGHFRDDTNKQIRILLRDTHAQYEWLGAPRADKGNKSVQAKTESTAYPLNWDFFKKHVVREEGEGGGKRLFHTGKYTQFAQNLAIWGETGENMPFILKAAPSSGSNWNIDDMMSNSDFPTLQMMHHGNGGSTGSALHYRSSEIGKFSESSGSDAVGIYPEAPPELAPQHVFGAKLLWFDESLNEAAGSGGVLSAGAPYRVAFWKSEDLTFNQAPIANWNMRASNIMRSPASPSARGSGVVSAYGTTNGAWALQTNPFVQTNAIGSVFPDNDDKYKKSPFGSPSSGLPNKAILFDFANPEFGLLSIGKLRHAPLSPQSYHPTYIVGSSLSDLHAPREQTAVDLFERQSTEKALLDLLGGGEEPYGPISGNAKGGDVVPPVYDSIFRAGKYSPSSSVLGQNVKGDREIPFYDIAYEVNHNLWDRFFVSGMKMSSARDSFTLNSNDLYWNQRHSFNPSSNIAMEFAKEKLESSSANQALEWAFWHNGAITMIDGQFNVNSTSVNAWKAFLSANRRLAGNLQDGQLSLNDRSKFSRVSKPLDYTEDADLTLDSGWSGARGLSDTQITLLANAIVSEVKLRGPFLSLADFVNRRLSDESDPSSRMGALDTAIYSTPINASIDSAYETDTTSNPGDNNNPILKDNYGTSSDESTVALSRGHGLPGYLTQGDILESHAFAMSARGETFTIRAYGESRGAGGEVKAEAWLEATVLRTPEYINARKPGVFGQDVNGANNSLDVAQMVDYRTGELLEGDLSEMNKTFGRRFKIISFKWIGSDDQFEL